jgi:hypothetical protein
MQFSSDAAMVMEVSQKVHEQFHFRDIQKTLDIYPMSFPVVVLLLLICL